jgi:hypothetical protein
MAINTQLPLGVQPMQIENPVNQLAKILQIKDMQQGQQMNALKMDEYRRGVAEAATQNELYAGAVGPDGTVDRNKLFQSLASRGLGSKIPGVQKQFMELDAKKADIGKTEAEAKYKQIETAHKRVDLAGQTMGWLRQNPSLENAQLVVNHLVSNGGMEPAEGQGLLAQLQANPQGIAQFAEMTFRSALAAKDQLAKIQTNNIGGQTVTQGIDPVTGKASMVSAVQNTQSPDNAASVAATMRGQNMTDARSREATAVQREGLQIQRDASRTELIQTPEGVIAVDKGTRQGAPVTMGGRPLPGKPSAATEKELVGIRQQNSIIDGAISAVDQTPSAFTFRRGTATMAGAIPESLAGRMDSDAERQARSYVFNNVSKVINERAGAAQSAQELARLRSFLPAETDNAAQIKSKLQAFKTYLGDMESGTRGTANKPASAGGWGIQRVN